MKILEQNIKPNNPEEIIKKYTNKMNMLWGDPIFDFEVHDGNIYINKYYDNENRKEVKIPEFVYGFLIRTEKTQFGKSIVGAFYECRYLEKIIGTSKLHGSMEALFRRMEPKNLILENFDTSNIDNMKYMFKNCGYREMQKIDLGDKFDTSNVTDMEGMFCNLGEMKMEKLELGDKFNTKKVINMRDMFMMCGKYAMKHIDLGDKFDTSNVITTESMFESCGQHKIEKLDLGDKFDTVNVTNMQSMFYFCGSMKMKQLEIGNKFDTSNVTDMNAMFFGCGQKEMTTLNLGSKFNVNNVTDMRDIFDNLKDKSVYMNRRIIDTRKFERTNGKKW